MIQTPLEHPLTTPGGTTVTILPYTLPLQTEGIGICSEREEEFGPKS